MNDSEIRTLAVAIARMLDRQRLDAELGERKRFARRIKKLAAQQSERVRDRETTA